MHCAAVPGWRERQWRLTSRSWTYWMRRKIGKVLDQLNIAGTVAAKNYTAEDLYFSGKLPFGFNYIDRNLDITHDNDNQTEHGSHVAGIAAANAYIPRRTAALLLPWRRSMSRALRRMPRLLP